jgi:hypothetical protein
MEALLSSETLVLARATQSYIPEDGILHGHRRENILLYVDYLMRLEDGYKWTALISDFFNAFVEMHKC